MNSPSRLNKGMCFTAESHTNSLVYILHSCGHNPLCFIECYFRSPRHLQPLLHTDKHASILLYVMFLKISLMSKIIIFFTDMLLLPCKNMYMCYEVIKLQKFSHIFEISAVSSTSLSMNVFKFTTECKIFITNVTSVWTLSCMNYRMSF
jgi:hypothetical protein